jgi:hypothetical protein
MTKPARDANLRWLGFLLAALVAVLVTLLGAGTASAAMATAAQTRVGAHTCVAPFVVGPHGGIGAGQRLGNDLPAYDFVLATGVAEEAATEITTTAAKAAPSAQEIIQSTARAQSARGVEALKGSLSSGERAAMEADSGLASRMLGQGVHRSTANALDKAYPGRFWYRTRGPDFVDRTTGEMLELTTPGEVGKHFARPGYSNVTMCTYTLPGC